MDGRRTEIIFNTPEQVREYLIAAVALVEELDVPSDLRPMAFRAAYDGLSGKNIQIEAPQALPLGAILGNGRR